MKTRQTIRHLPIEQLRAHPGNIRDDLGDVNELALSIREHGILQPLVLTEHPTDPDHVDEAAVRRVLDGHWDTPCNPAEKREVIRRWAAGGRPIAELARRTGWKPERYYRATDELVRGA